jgi:D-alanyl-D-alanine carboxypeptidase
MTDVRRVAGSRGGRVARRKKRWRGQVVAVLAALLAGAAPAAAASPANAPMAAPLQSALTQLIQTTMSQWGYPGLSVGIWSPARGSYVRAFGVADIASGRPMTLADHVRVGSVTKPFTATLVLQEVRAGRLRLDERLSRFYPRFPGARTITIRELLNHSSGIYDYASDPAFEKELEAHPARRWTPGELIAIAAGQPLYFTPGTGYHYSDTNYVMLGQILRRVTHRTVGALLRSHILRPLGLRRTAYLPDAPLPQPRAHGYLIPSGQPPTDITGWSYSWTQAAGGLSSTLDDLRRWAPVLGTGALLTPALRRQQRRFIPTGIPGLSYGLGIASAGTMVGHNGLVPGYDSVELYSPSLRATIVMVSDTSPQNNGAPAGEDTLQLAVEAMTIVYPPTNAALSGSAAVLRGRVAPVALACQTTGVVPCRGTVTLTQGAATLGTARFRVAPGATRNVGVRLPRSTVDAVRSAGALQVQATVRTTQPLGLGGATPTPQAYTLQTAQYAAATP